MKSVSTPFLRCDLVTIFPEMIQNAIQWGILRRAQESGRCDVRAVNLRDFAEGRHRVVDDYLYGGEPGMLLKPEPLFRAVRTLKAESQTTPKVVLLSPQGTRLTQNVAERLSMEPHLILLCGRYKGVDERVRIGLVDEEISVGDYILSGGELPALVLLEAVVRLVPGVLTDAESAFRDSFGDGLLDAPHYTRPSEWEGMRVPEVLLSGDPKKIARWRRTEALRNTLRRRPDLLETATLTDEDLTLLETMVRYALTGYSPTIERLDDEQAPTRTERDADDASGV